MTAVLMEFVYKQFRGALKSWTIWFNSLAAFAAFGLPELAASLPLVAEYLPGDLYGKVFIATLVGNIFLRFKTRRPLEYK